MKRLSIRVVLSVGLLLPATAFADEDEAPPPAKEGTFALTFDYSLGTYLDVPVENEGGGTTNQTVNQGIYAVSFRGTSYDWTKKTPLGAVPGVWFDFNIGWIGAGQDGAGFGDDGGGGLLWNTRLAGPWKIFHSKNLKIGGGIGFTFGIQMGLPAQIRGEYMLAFDAFVMGVAELELGGLKTMVEGEYAAGSDYNEQRFYGHVAVGKFAVGGQLILGQADIDYFQAGVNLGFRWNSDTL
jgi:hypothetical protein